MNNFIEIEKLRKEYGKFTLDNVSLKLEKGSILGLIGPNGAGKTTAIKLMMNMLRPDGGETSIFGMKYPENEKEIKDRIGYVGEEQFFYGGKKISWTGRFVSQFFSRWDQAAFDSYLQEFGLDPGQRTGKLSKGMKVKLSFAIALSHNPDLLILDEPTAGLDPVIRREMLEKLLEFRGDEERSVFISSHITDDIMRVADHVAFIVDGKIVINTEKEEIISNWKRIHFRPGSIGHDITSSLLSVERHAFGSSGVTDRYSEIEGRIADSLKKGDVKVENVSLDDVLITFVKGDES